MLQRVIDTARFVAGAPARNVRIGQTPHTVIHRQGPASLRWFAPGEATRAPVFISMPLINTWSIWDLLPDRSVVRAVRASRFTPARLDGEPAALYMRVKVDFER